MLLIELQWKMLNVVIFGPRQTDNIDQKIAISKWASSHDLVVRADGSKSRGRGFKPLHY